jgi:hypothetical protein
MTRVFSAAFAALTLAAAMSGVADAKFLLPPAALPATAPAMQVSDDCDPHDRAHVLSALSDVRAFYLGLESGRGPSKAESPSGLTMRAEKRGSVNFVSFSATSKNAPVSNKLLGECLTIYAGSPEMFNKLDLYVPDNTVPLGWFTYSAKLGIYSDPRTVNLFPPKHA